MQPRTPAEFRALLGSRRERCVALMRLIGHRGVASLEPENTLASIDSARSLGVDMIEIDVRTTRDGHLVLLHDHTLHRITGKAQKVSDLTIDEINTTITHSGHPIPLLHEAFEHAGKIPLLIDCKGKDWARLLDIELEKHKGPKPALVSTDQRELVLFNQLRPGYETYASELTKPISAVYSAKQLGFTGLALNFWILNPLSYHYAQRLKLKIIVYTINQAWLARFVRFFYPDVSIISDVPDKIKKAMGPK